jgi:phenylalanyl-tRNA synthetase beta chain
VTVPSFRIGDVEIEEDIIEEIARIYGYHNLPSLLPPQT